MRAVSSAIFGIALAVALTPVTAVSGELEDAFKAAMDAKPDAARSDAPDNAENGDDKTLTPGAAVSGPLEDGLDAAKSDDLFDEEAERQSIMEAAGRRIGSLERATEAIEMMQLLLRVRPKSLCV